MRTTSNYMIFARRASLFIAAVALTACAGSSSAKPPISGTGGNGGSGGSGGSGGTGGTPSIPTGPTPDAAPVVPGGSLDAAPAPTVDSGSTPPVDAAAPADGAPSPSDGTSSSPAVPRPDAMGQECKSAANEAFTVSAFEPQTGVFTAWFTATPSIAPTNSVVGLSDGDVGPGSGDTPLHNLHQILLRFGASGALDARNGAVYSADNVIKYEAIPYDFRLVVNVPAKTFSAYVSWKGQPEVTIGTNLAYRDTARPATKFDHWAVEANGAKTTVCGFIVRAN
jgi:hypothetical protein